jgi:hypothetical protein
MQCRMPSNHASVIAWISSLALCVYDPSAPYAASPMGLVAGDILTTVVLTTPNQMSLEPHPRVAGLGTLLEKSY